MTESKTLTQNEFNEIIAELTQLYPDVSMEMFEKISEKMQTPAKQNNERYELPLLPEVIGGEDCNIDEYNKNLKEFKNWYKEFCTTQTKDGWVGFWVENGAPKYVLRDTMDEIICYTEPEHIRMKLGKKIGDIYIDINIPIW